jgi:23S rRNA pseudouridine2605 synthase
VWLLHKPVGYVTTAADEHGRDTVYTLLPEGHGWLGPVGRLDQDSSGLLLFTNDSDLAHAITDPKTKLAKVYEVRCKGRLREASVAALRDGVDLHDGRTLPAKVEVLDHDDRSTLLRMEITEGKNRQIRRMVQAVGSRVHTLHRVRIGPLELGDVPEGGSRKLSAQEVLDLRSAVRTRQR